MTSKIKLTNTSIKNLDPPESGYSLIWDSDLSGFGLRITSAGSRSFIAESRVNGKTRRVTIGQFGKFTADQARKAAKAKLGAMAQGTDPNAEKRQQKAESVTLAEVTDAYLENRRTRDGRPLKDRTKKDVRYHLDKTFQGWKEKPIVEISREMVSRRYAKCAKASPAQANQAMRVLRAIISYAAATYRTPDGARIIADNPVDVLRESSMLRSVAPRKNHVPLEKIGLWWSAVQAMRTDPALNKASRSAADLVALLALTGLRIGEARAIPWENLDMEEGSLVLRDTKNRTETLTLPLSDLAVEILKARTNSSPWVFPARSGKGHLLRIETHLAKISKATGVEVSPHDLRRTFSAVAGAVDVELWRTKALMGHKQRADVTLAHYKDLSDVRHLKPEADRIAEYYEHQRRIHESDNVVDMRARA